MDYSNRRRYITSKYQAYCRDEKEGKHWIMERNVQKCEITFDLSCALQDNSLLVSYVSLLYVKYPCLNSTVLCLSLDCSHALILLNLMHYHFIWYSFVLKNTVLNCYIIYINYNHWTYSVLVYTYHSYNMFWHVSFCVFSIDFKKYDHGDFNNSGKNKYTSTKYIK